MEDRTFNIRYDIINTNNGRWTIQAYDRNNKPLGIAVICTSSIQASKIFVMLTGSYDLLEEITIRELEKVS